MEINENESQNVEGSYQATNIAALPKNVNEEHNWADEEVQNPREHSDVVESPLSENGLPECV